MYDLPDDWQRDSINKALHHVKDFSLAIDVGAHRGIITRQLLKRFRHVVAVEPVEHLCKQIDAQAWRHNVALGAAEGVGALEAFGDNTGQTRVIAGQSVRVHALDNLCTAHAYRPTFIKLDVEGMEVDVLRGGENTIRALRPVLMVEENGLGAYYGHNDNAVYDLLTGWGATCFGVVQKWQTGNDMVYGWPA